MKGLILSGGKGTRLRPITHTAAKQLVPVANKPILFYALEAVVAAGITDIGIIVGDTAAEIRDAVGDGRRFGARVSYIEQDAPRGLAHAVMVAREFLGDDRFVVYLGDNLILDGISPLVREFGANGSDATILLARVPQPERFGVAELESGRVVRLVEKPERPRSDLALVGVYMLGPAVFEAISHIGPSGRGELEITDALQRMIDVGRSVKAHTISGWWKDTGRLEDLLEANRILLDSVTPRCDAAVCEASDLAGKVVVEPGAVVRRTAIRGPAVIGRDTVLEDAYIGPFTSVSDRCTVRHAEIEHSIVLEDSHIEDVGVRIESSLIGRGCVVRRSPGRPAGHRLMIGDHSRVELP